MTVSLCLLLAFWPRIGVAQSKEFRHVEVGALAGFLDLNTINGEKPLTLGLRAGYRVNTAFGVEGEWAKVSEPLTTGWLSPACRRRVVKEPGCTSGVWRSCEAD